ncbi:MAG TPA: hypothetical protein VGT04_02415 [Acidobacteriaceae bacterium]|nr:hypothetical protein [Acidobacteriaceae bacterium]
MTIAPAIAGQHSQPSTRRVLRKIFSFPTAISLMLMLLALLTVRGRFDDPDMWWQLKNGQVIWTTHSIPTVDQYSFTALHHAIVPEEWFPELIIYGAYHFGGYSGMMVWLCCFASLLLIAGYVLCTAYSGNAKIGFVGAMVVWFFATVGLSIRGQLIGYLLLIVELLLLHMGRNRNPRWFLALPLLMLLWVNCHGSFFFGLIVIGVYFLCSFFNFRAGGLVCFGEARQKWMLLWALVLSSAAVFINPVGWSQVVYPLDTMLRQPVNLASVQEWQPLTLSDPRGAGLMVLLAAVLVIFLVRRTEVLHLEELLLLAVGSWLALSHQRLAFVFGILAAPVISRLLAPMWDRYEPDKDRIAPNAALFVLAVLVAIFAFPRQASLEKKVYENSPVRAVDYIQAHHLSGNMLNAYGEGGYLIWAMPQHPVFIDGRADLYEWAGVLAQFGQWATLQADPNTLLNKYNIAFCLLERDSAMAHVMPLLKGWTQVYSDQQSVIFVRSKQSPGPV